MLNNDDMDKTAYRGEESKLNGLSEAQEEACYSALQAFRERHGLDYWGLTLNLTDDGPQTWQVDITVMASPELDFQIRSSHVTIDKTLDLARVVDLCLETHYHTCMNSKAISLRSNRSSKPPQSEDVLDSRAG